MAKINYQNCPSAWLPMLARVLRWFDSHNSAVVSSPNQQKTRKDSYQRSQASFFKTIAASWNPLEVYTKQNWQTAAVYCKKTNYKLFVADFSYRHRTGLSEPGIPNNYHQLWGLTLHNPGGVADVTAIWRTIAVTGPITLKVSISKNENTLPTTTGFQIKAIAYYFEGGENKTEEYIYTAPDGNIDWCWQQFSFGTAGRWYFELEVYFLLNQYDADVTIDNLKIDDTSGELYYEYFNPVRPYDWEPVSLVRKEGWIFEPFWDPMYFEQTFIE
jgi:hypothetical protein